MSAIALFSSTEKHWRGSTWQHANRSGPSMSGGFLIRRWDGSLIVPERDDMSPQVAIPPTAFGYLVLINLSIDSSRGLSKGCQEDAQQERTISISTGFPLGLPAIRIAIHGTDWPFRCSVLPTISCCISQSLWMAWPAPSINTTIPDPG